MMWIDQTITLNNETFNRLQRVSLILEKGHLAHQSLKLVYLIVALLSILAIIIVMELACFNRRVSFRAKSRYIFECVYLLASNEGKFIMSREGIIKTFKKYGLKSNQYGS